MDYVEFELLHDALINVARMKCFLFHPGDIRHSGDGNNQQCDR